MKNKTKQNKKKKQKKTKDSREPYNCIRSRNLFNSETRKKETWANHVNIYGGAIELVRI